MSRLTVSAQTLAGDVAAKEQNPENIWILCGIVVLIGLVGIAVWVRRRNRRS